MTAGEISDLLMGGVATAYTISMFAFVTNLVTSYGPGKVPEGSVRTNRTSLGIATSVAWLGLVIHLGAIVARGIAAGRPPWANMYEFCMVGTFVAMAVFLVVSLRKDIRFLGTFVTGAALLFIMAGLLRFHIPPEGVQPALQSYWLVIHVGVAVSATGVLTIGCICAVLQLVRGSYDAGSTFLRGEGTVLRGHNRMAWRFFDWHWLASLPRAGRLEVLSFRFNAVGFVLWTFTLIAGSIWAEHAWGRYWGWDPKEVWTFVVWVVYAAYLHARATQRWTGRRAAYFVIVGYVCVLFNFTGVNILFDGKHSYANLPTK